MMFGRKETIQAQEMDREYGAAQGFILYQFPRFSDAGKLVPGDDRSETLRRIVLRIVQWGVSYEDLQKRAFDHSVWMYACKEHPDEVVRWDEEFSGLTSDEERFEAAEQFRNRYTPEYIGYAAEHPELA